MKTRVYVVYILIISYISVKKKKHHLKINLLQALMQMKNGRIDDLVSP